MKKWHFILSLAFIITLGFILRVILILFLPQGLHVDEGLLVYNAIQLAATGQDAFKMAYPLHLLGFGWGENVLLCYILMLFIKITGISNILSFRIIIILFHCCFIIFASLLSLELFNKKTALVTACLLILSPWDLALSQYIFNVSILPVFFIGGLYFLILGIKKDKWYYFLPAGSLYGLSFYIYESSFIWVPLILAITLFLFKDQVRKQKWHGYLLLFFPLIALGLPVFIYNLNNQFYLFATMNQFLFFSLPGLFVTRFDQVSIFSLPYYCWILEYVKNYLLHLNPVFLFLNANLAALPRNFGLYFIWQLPFFIVGLIYILTKKHEAAYKLLIFWLLIAPIPVAFTMENVPHALRFVTALPVIDIIIAIGLIKVLDVIKIRDLGRKYLPVIIVFIMLNLGWYIYNEVFIYPEEKQYSFHAQDQQITQYILDNYDKYDCFSVFTGADENRNYIFKPYNFLVYSHLLSRNWANKNMDLIGDDFAIDKLHFSRRLFNPEQNNRKNVFLASSQIKKQYFSDLKVLFEFKGLNNKVLYYAFQ